MVMLGSILSRTSPDGMGALTYVLRSFEGQGMYLGGIDTKLTYVASAYLDDEACEHLSPNTLNEDS